MQYKIIYKKELFGELINKLEWTIPFVYLKSACPVYYNQMYEGGTKC